MAPQVQPRFAHSPRTHGDPRPAGTPDGAWWPQSRRLSEQLENLFASWPPEQPRIMRVLYSPPDWDDLPRKVGVAGRWVKTGHFPTDDTATITLTLSDRSRQAITVIAPDAAAEVAAEVLAGVNRPASRTP